MDEQDKPDCGPEAIARQVLGIEGGADVLRAIGRGTKLSTRAEVHTPTVIGLRKLDVLVLDDRLVPVKPMQLSPFGHQVLAALPAEATMDEDNMPSTPLILGLLGLAVSAPFLPEIPGTPLGPVFGFFISGSACLTMLVLAVRGQRRKRTR